MRCPYRVAEQEVEEAVVVGVPALLPHLHRPSPARNQQARAEPEVNADSSKVGFLVLMKV
jgi:hypothetical protein